MRRFILHPLRLSAFSMRNVARFDGSGASSFAALLASPAFPLCQSTRENSNRSSVTRVQRAIFPKHYKTMLCLRDGSTLTVRCRDPVKIVVVPDDLNSMDEKAKKLRFSKRKTKVESSDKDEYDDHFDFDKYIK